MRRDKCDIGKEPSIPGKKHGDFWTIIAQEETDNVLYQVNKLNTVEMQKKANSCEKYELKACYSTAVQL